MTPPKPLSADRPLDDPQYDRLGYAPFAKQLANSILKGSPSDGLVVALYGDWGTGKTTALKFIVHHLKLQEEEPIVMWFNPWWFAGQEDLIRRFFKQFQSTVVKSKLLGTKARTDALAKVVHLFGELLSSTPSIPGVPGVAEAGKAAGKGAKAIAAKLAPTDVVEVKEQIAAALAGQAARIVVIIDDIDRLVTEEVRQLFQLIKAVADFPNVIYLLAFDRRVAVHAMKDIHGVGGDEYLEKIVQVPFALPPPERAQLQQLLFERLNEIIAETPDAFFNKDYWAEVFHHGVDDFIEKPRDVVRLSNALSVTYPAVFGEVHAVDFIAIETLRVFAPAAYEIIRMNPKRFTYPNGRVDRDDGKKEREFHEAWLAQLSEQAGPVRHLVATIFPRWGALFGNMGYSENYAAEWRRTLRVCSPEVFPTYFRLAVPTSGIAATEVRQLLQLAGDPDAFGARLRQLSAEKMPDGHSRAGLMLSRLRDHAKEVPRANIKDVVAALFEVGDDLIRADTHERSMFDLGDEYRIGWLLRDLLERLPAKQRAKVLLAAVQTGKAFVAMVNEVMSLGREHGRRGTEASRPDAQLIPDEKDVEKLEEAVAVRLVPAAATGALWDAVRPETLLDAVMKWVNPTAAREMVAERIKDDAALFSFLKAFTSRTHSFGMFGGGVTTTVELDPLLLWKWVDDVEKIEVRLKKLAKKEITEEQRVIVDAFIAGCAARRAGKEPRWGRTRREAGGENEDQSEEDEIDAESSGEGDDDD